MSDGFRFFFLPDQFENAILDEMMSFSIFAHLITYVYVLLESEINHRWTKVLHGHNKKLHLNVCKQ